MCRTDAKVSHLSGITCVSSARVWKLLFSDLIELGPISNSASNYWNDVLENQLGSLVVAKCAINYVILITYREFITRYEV